MTKHNDSKDKKSATSHDVYPCMKMGRRGFLKTTGVTLAGLTGPLGLSSCEEGPIMLDKPAKPRGTASVGITRKNDIETAVRTAVDLAGGLGDIASGDRVIIKPNITGPELTFPARIFTHPEVLRGVIRTVKDRTASTNITVAEASGFGLPTKLWARRTGILDVCEEEGVNFLAWEDNDYVTVFSDHFEHLDFEFRVPLSLYDGSFDHFINVPILKNHDMVPDTNVDFTCCIKNHVGCMMPRDRMFGGEDGISELITHPVLNSGIHKATLGDIAAEINLAIPTHTMNVVDALTIILTGGPAAMEMDTAEAGLILASKDRVACDSLAVAVLKLYAQQEGLTDMPYVYKSVWNQAQIQRAQQLNLGRTKENIEIVDENVDNIADILAQWA